MNVSDAIFFGWYQILDKTIYVNSNGQEGIGPKEHSFFITFLLHGINVWTVLRYLAITYFKVSINLYLSLSIAGIIFLIGYLTYFRKKRALKIISSDRKLSGVLFSVILSLIYTTGTVYLMLETGNYAREILQGGK